MNNWPLFEQRYAPETLPQAPGYQDTLVALVLVMLFIGAIFWGLRKRYIHKQVSAKRGVFSVYAVLQSIVVIGLIYANTLGTSDAYWRAAGEGLLLGLGYFTFNTLLYGISWYTFGTKEYITQWFGKYFTIWSVLGFALILPLIISINLSEFESLFFVLFAIIYLLFRVTLLVISLTTFPKLRKYPLHIIWYLCTCEIAPLLFLLV